MLAGSKRFTQATFQAVAKNRVSDTTADTDSQTRVRQFIVSHVYDETIIGGAAFGGKYALKIALAMQSFGSTQCETGDHLRSLPSFNAARSRQRP